MSELSRYNRYISCLIGGTSEFDFRDKEKCISQHICYMLNRTQSMFRWNNLPDTIPQRDLELMLQINGNVGVASHEGNLYAFVGGLGGEPNVYYMPTLYTVANPALKLSKSFVIDEDIIIIPNDASYIGLIPLFERYASAITETEISMLLANINTRIMSFISASDDRTKSSAEKFIEDISNGKLSVIGETAFFDGVKVQPNSSYNNVITNLIELEQYFKASWFNELGLNANYNMKRESINSGESQLNNDALLPLVDDMLKQRQVASMKINDMFGTDISVEYNSSWEDNIEEIDAEIKEKEDEATPEENTTEEGETNVEVET